MARATWLQFASARQRMTTLRRHVARLLDPNCKMPAHRPPLAIGVLEIPLVSWMWWWFEHLARQGSPVAHVSHVGCPTWLTMVAQRALGSTVRKRTRSERRWRMRCRAAAVSAVAGVVGVSPRTFDEGLRAWRDAKILAYYPSFTAALSDEERGRVLQELKDELNPTFTPVSLGLLYRWTAA
jgi:hypothetical protein